ncbi:MAG: hypothetical protein ACF8QF_13275 [Phycisphaerales bacterium]
MASRGTKKKKASKTARAERDGAAGLRIAGRAASALVLLGACVGVAVGQGWLADRVSETRADPLVQPRFDWPATPGSAGTWMPADERERLEQIVLATVSRDPFDGESLDNARLALQHTGWFETLSGVRRLPGGVVKVDGAFRQPAAVVRTGNRDLLVGLRGELLPLEYRAGASWPLRFIRGVDAGPPRRVDGTYDYGGAWAVGDVQAAIALLSRLRRTSQWEHVAGVDVTDFLRAQRLTIITDRGAEIVWGAPPGRRTPGERSDDEKARAFEQLFTNPGWISAGMPRVEIFPPVILIDETAPGG